MPRLHCAVLRRALLTAWVLFAAALSTGCAAVPYEYDLGIEDENTLWLAPGEPQIERGHPKPFLDGVGHYAVSLPSKLILWSWDVDRHCISPETEEALRKYLDDNGLANVKVRLNAYAPGDEWSRLFRNGSVHWFWRYTLGVLSCVGYTIMPGRFFGGDNYNPFTNTIHVYSDDPAILLHEGAHAKHTAATNGTFLRGLFAFLYAFFPPVTLYEEASATGDTVGYYIDKRDTAGQKDAYEILYPAFGTYVAGTSNFQNWLGLGYLEQLALAMAGALPGHIVGRIASSNVEEQPTFEP